MADNPDPGNPKHLHYDRLVYPQFSTPNGPLPTDMGAQACFFFYMSAEKMREMVGDGASTQIIYEGDLWMDTHYENLARGIASQYGLDDPGVFERYWPAVAKVCEQEGWPPPHPNYTRRIRPTIIM